MQDRTTDTIIDYLVYRQWRGNVFFNFSLLILGALIAKIVSNFCFGQPGFAGIRVSPSYDE
jgi:hypothetical protein